MYGEGYRLHISFQNIFNSNNERIASSVVQKFNGKILNQLNSRVALQVDKDRILECIIWLKTQSGINWLVSQPSLYDVFTTFVN